MKDLVRRADYSETLVAAAEHYLVERLSDGEAPENAVLVNVSMAIVNGDAWQQPDPAQVQLGIVRDQIQAAKEARQETQEAEPDASAYRRTLRL
jgi:hypothetical protein